MSPISREEQDDAHVLVDRPKAFILWLVIREGYTSAADIRADYASEADVGAEVDDLIRRRYLARSRDRLHGTPRGESVVGSFAPSRVGTARKIALQLVGIFRGIIRKLWPLNECDELSVSGYVLLGVAASAAIALLAGRLNGGAVTAGALARQTALVFGGLVVLLPASALAALVAMFFANRSAGGTNFSRRAFYRSTVLVEAAVAVAALVVLDLRGEEVTAGALVVKMAFIFGGLVVLLLVLVLVVFILLATVASILGNRRIEALGCFPGETLVGTIGGETRIDGLRPGDMIAAYDERLRAVRPGTITAVRQTRAAQLVSIGIAGTPLRLRCTPCHPIFTSRGLIRAGRVAPGDRLLSQDGDGVSESVVCDVATELSTERVFNVYVTGGGTYFAASQLVSSRYRLRKVRAVLSTLRWKVLAAPPQPVTVAVP